MDRRKWCVGKYDREAVENIVNDTGAQPYAALILASRGITDSSEADGYLGGSCGLCDPYILPDMDKAVREINNSVDAGERIAIYGDYDADGLTATAVLYSYLQSQGADVFFYIPDRNTEGYGMNIGAIDRIYEQGAGLIITVDNGISAFDEADYIKKKGMKLVITDHHKVSDRLPDALAVVNPHRKDSFCPFEDWAGVGVAFKLVCALEGDEGEYLLDEYAQLVTVGTVADVVPLMGENRYIVRRGIEMMNTEPMEWIQVLGRAAGIADKPITSVSIAYTIVPRINAMGRIGSVAPVMSLLLEEGDMAECAEMMNERNSLRQKIELDIMQDIRKIIDSEPSILNEPVIILSHEGWHAGIVGIAASRVVEKYCKPCLIVSVDGENAKGSGRSIEGFSLFDAICSAKDVLTHFGGHTLAVGFSLKTADIGRFKEYVNGYAKSITMPFRTLNIDCRLRPEALDISVAEAFGDLEPFGAGNPQPLVGIFGATLTGIQAMGQGKHLRLIFTKNGCQFSTVRFGEGEDKFPYEPGDVLDLAVRLEVNEFRGEKKPSVQIRGIRPAGRNDDGFLEGIALFEKIMRNGELTPQEAQRACPDRKFVSSVYKTIRNLKSAQADIDKLCMTTGFGTDEVCRTLVSVEALCGLGILRRNEEGNPVMPDVTVRNELDNSVLLNRLKSIAGC